MNEQERIEFQGSQNRLRVIAAVVEAAYGPVLEYVRLLRRHPKHHCNVDAYAKVTGLAKELSRDADLDMANPEQVAMDLRSLSRDDSTRPRLREYKRALDACVRDCREEAGLDQLAAQLKRDVRDDLRDSTSVRHLLEDIRSMRRSLQNSNSEAYYDDRRRWKALKKTLKIFGWYSPKKKG